MLEYPSISLTILGCTPFVSSKVAQVCLRSWNLMSGSPALSRSGFQCLSWRLSRRTGYPAWCRIRGPNPSTCLLRWCVRSAGALLVLDKLVAHRTEKVKDLIEERGADIVFLPSYSPEMNPIEEAFSKIKQLLRKAGARVREALVEAIGRALRAVTIEDAAGWFAHAGYWPQDQSL